MYEFMTECWQEYKAIWATKEGWVTKIRCGMGDAIYAIILAILIVGCLFGLLFSGFIAVLQQFDVPYGMAYGNEHWFSLLLLVYCGVAGWIAGGMFMRK
jgi:hypothetical protein